MIDVVFLLLIFFMLASRFGTMGALPLVLPTQSTAPWEGPPRLVQIGPQTLRLNGSEIGLPDLAAALAPLMTEKSDPVILLPDPETDLQRLVTVMESLRSADMTTLILADP